MSDSDNMGGTDTERDPLLGGGSSAVDSGGYVDECPPKAAEELSTARLTVVFSSIWVCPGDPSVQTLC